MENKDKFHSDEIELMKEEMMALKNQNRLMRKEIDADVKEVRQLIELICLVDLSILQIAIAELQAQTQKHTQEMNDCNDKWRVANDKEVKIQFIK